MKTRHVYHVEGESVTLADIAARADLAPGSVYNKVRRESRNGPLTWAALRFKGKRRAPFQQQDTPEQEGRS